MQLYESPSGIEVTLSRRNILALLHKLDWEGSARTIQKECGNGMILTLVAEEDDEHYDGNEPGVMHTATESFIQSYGGSE